NSARPDLCGVGPVMGRSTTIKASMEFVLDYQKSTLVCSLERYEWSLGIGVLARFSENNQKIGALKLLCDCSHERYEEISLLSVESIFEHIKAALENGVLNSSISKMILWQSELSKQEFNGVSPLYVQLTDAF
ncbi:hypothetical protein, partial [Motilimonas sp. KMU-193]|uniref:hypothetical protein n=1 Tax=Motilimonas sp. KMU-193 TaxID=3388668 RepID=UPI00396B218E